MHDTSPTPQLDALMREDADLVDRIFEYVLQEFPEIQRARLQAAKRSVRERFGGREEYVRSAATVEREEQADQVLALFNGRNATEVARRLKISRATVYRLIKQPGRKKSQGSG